MTQISRDAILKLAQLSSLQLSDDEIDGLHDDIGRILGYVEQLEELDTSDIEPAYQVTGLDNVFRDDVIDATGPQPETLLALAPERVGNQIKVPKVL